MNHHQWERFDRLMAQHAPRLFTSLNPPASPKLVDEVERQIGMRFPDDLRLAYLHHNGSPEVMMGNEVANFFYPDYRWSSLEQVLQDWQKNCEHIKEWRSWENPEHLFPPPDDEVWQIMTLKIRPEHLCAKWIPIARTNMAAPTIFVDMQPGPSGELGQLVAWDPEIGPNLFIYSNSNRQTMTVERYILALSEGMENDSVTYDEHGWNIKE